MAFESLSRRAGSLADGAPRGGAAIEVRGLSHRYGELTVLQGLDLDLEAGGYLALTGASGAGKSTLLSLLGGLERPREGRVQVGGQDLSRLSGDALAAYRRATVGFVFQHFGLIDVLSAQENVEMALALSGTSRRQRRARARELLDQVELAGRADHRPTALSGGERQRVAIARALANRPRLLLADEPTGNLDEAVAHQVLDLLERLRDESGCTLVVVSHNRAVAGRATSLRRLDVGRWVA
jgi:putative ABC transport system ATP-binding protein